MCEYINIIFATDGGGRSKSNGSRAGVDVVVVDSVTEIGVSEQKAAH